MGGLIAYKRSLPDNPFVQKCIQNRNKHTELSTIYFVEAQEFAQAVALDNTGRSIVFCIVMNEFIRSNKISGIRWLKTPIDNMKIRVKLKVQDSILRLPKYEEYSNEVNSLNLEHNIEEYNFKWQEKRFSTWDSKHYGDIFNCVTDLDISYNDLVKNGNIGQKVFSYIHEDSYLPLPFEESKKADTKSWINHFNEKVEMFFANDTVSMRHLFKSEENICMDTEQWMTMHIVFDNSTYNEISELLVKQEIVLLSLYYNTTKQYLIISPDTNNLEMNPYTVELDNGTVLDYHYSIEVMSDDYDNEDEDGDNELKLLLQKLYDKLSKKQKNLIGFVLPPIGKKQFHTTIEIMSAANFEMSNIYIEYNIKLPEGVVCKDSQNGRTHISEARIEDDMNIYHFGHPIELSIEIDSDQEPKPLKIFFEAISIDWWGRHRTEGYTHISLPLLPGGRTKNLACLRPDESDTVAADNRRFFLGGCHLIKDLDILVQSEMDPSIIFQSTGQISLRWSTICQSSKPCSVTLPTPSTSAASALLVGAEAALTQYRKARAKLKAATRDLEAGDG